MDITNKVSSFAERLDYALKQTNRKQADLAREANLSRNVVSRYIQGTAKPTHATLLRIAQILQVSEHWLTGFDVPSGILSQQTLSEQDVTKLEYALLSRNESNLYFVDGTLMKEIGKSSTFPERLAVALQESKKTKADLAREVKVSRAGIYDYLSGEYLPTIEAFTDIAQALNVSELWLAGFDVPMKRSSEEDTSDSPCRSEGAQKEAQEALALVGQVLLDPSHLKLLKNYFSLSKEDQSKANAFIVALANKNEKTS